jgi:hypothetical protein
MTLCERAALITGAIACTASAPPVATLPFDMYVRPSALRETWPA